MGKFEVKTRKNGEFQFSLLAGNGQTILSSEGYSTKAACISGIESVRKNSANDALFERKVGANGKDFFVLKAANHQVIGQSQLYESKASMENGIESVKKNAPDATVDDQTGA